MRRGTTPTITMRLPNDVKLNTIVDAILSIGHFNVEIIVKQFSDFMFDTDNNALSVTLTQEDTFALRSDAKADIQLKIKTIGGVVMASKIVSVSVDRILNEDVM